MYKWITIPDNIKATEAVIVKPIERHGVGLYVESNPDDVGPDVFIDPADEKGIALFREFATKILQHFKTLKTKS